MKILISDVDQQHANSLVSRIQAYCPTATIVIRIEPLSSSVSWASLNNVDLICRATTGLSDYRNSTDGRTAWKDQIGIIHAHGANSHIRLSDPSQLDVICAVGYGNDTPSNQGSYGPGLEFFADASSESEATARVTGMIAQLLINHTSWDFHDARQALRQTASNYDTGLPDNGFVEDGGFGLVDFTAADAVTSLDYDLGADFTPPPEPDPPNHDLPSKTGFNVGALRLTGATPIYSDFAVPKDYIDTAVTGEKEFVLFPEYAGAVLYADGSNNNGSFTSSFESSGGLEYFTFYHWRANAVNQHGEIILRTFVPSDLATWKDEAMLFEFKTGVQGEDKIDFRLYKRGEASPLLELLGLSSSDEWITTGVSSSYFTSLQAGDELLVRIDCTASSGSNHFVNVGSIRFQYRTGHVYVYAKAFLEGAYDTSLHKMTTDLNDLGYIPLSQPYSGAPWNYNGREKVNAIPSNVTDWILLELRASIQSSTIVSRRAAFLKDDGSIVDLDGVSPVYFAGVVPGNYYLVIKHRNHLAIMSAEAQPLFAGKSPLYDFTSTLARAYSVNADPMKQVEEGVYALYAGDASANGIVEGGSGEADYEIWGSQVGMIGYKKADFNMSGEVQQSDKNDYMSPNNHKSTQVPNDLQVYVNLKVFLEGPYDTSYHLMQTYLYTEGYIPLTQPYSGSPWNYSGTEQVSSIPSQVVDWVLVELRNTAQNPTVVHRRAAFILYDGTIVDINGSGQLRFPDATPGDYYVVIYHRNHLAIMSANPITLYAGTNALYDFTDSFSKAYWGDMKEVETGIYAMYAGDANSNGIIEGQPGESDYDLVDADRDSTGYLNTDINLSGIVTVGDLTSVSNNDNKSSRVPNDLQVYVNLKVFLEGAYLTDTNTLDTILRSEGYIPLTQPYSGSPWNYSGTEQVGSIPPQVVDWVLVELRNTAQNPTVVHRRAAFILYDGTIVDINGSGQLCFPDADAGGYYIVIYHRNHLAIMSANPVTLSLGPNSQYDFTNSLSKVYGGDMREVETGVFAMYAGDADSNGIIEGHPGGSDYDLVDADHGNTGYLATDVRMTGKVTVTDLIVVANNDNKQTNVPT